jgi:AcrR family transcriptional regulator
MRRGIFIFVFALMLAASAFSVYRHFSGREALVLSGRENAELEWLRQEFKLDEEEFSRIAALHEAYGPKCNALCAAVVEANARLGSAMEVNRRITPEITAALRHTVDVEHECRRALLEHVYSVSAEMKPEAARRYISMMKPRIVRSAEMHHRAMTSELH